MNRESMEFDVVIVGAGPAGLSAAIRLQQLSKQSLRICVVEKGSEVGAHILSGAVLEPCALNELIPDWQNLGAPINTPAIDDQFLFLTENKSFHLPTPKPMQNDGNYIISLGNLCRWLAKQAENCGVEIYPGFAATEILYDEQNRVIGIATGAMGIDKEGNPTSQYQPGMELHAKQTFFAEGCRGSLTKMLIKKYELDKECDPQTYAIGIKELWEISPEKHKPGTVIHTVGWPLDFKTYGGSFLYHADNQQIAVGFVIGLDYQNPYLNPFAEMQRFKLHPHIRPLFENGKRISYGARALVEGGFQSLPKLSVPGALIIGDAAGFLNVPKIKGTHTAMKSAMIAAETFFAAGENVAQKELIEYKDNLQKSWLWDELYRVRNIRPAFQWGLIPGLAYSAVDTYILNGRAPWTLKNHADYKSLKKASESPIINYPKADNQITFDRLSSVFLSNTNHEENQPCHLKLIDSNVAIDINLKLYNSPEQRYCPAGVYEIVKHDNDKPYLQINAQNCVHCKTCDIKDPTQNINWVPPQGGGGPNYPNM